MTSNDLTGKQISLRNLTLFLDINTTTTTTPVLGIREIILLLLLSSSIYGVYILLFPYMHVSDFFQIFFLCIILDLVSHSSNTHILIIIIITIHNVIIMEILLFLFNLLMRAKGEILYAYTLYIILLYA